MQEFYITAESLMKRLAVLYRSDNCEHTTAMCRFAEVGFKIGDDFNIRPKANKLLIVDQY